MYKRILILSYMFPRNLNDSNGIFIYDQAKELNKKGLKVILLVPLPIVPNFLKNKARHNIINTTWIKNEDFKINYVKYITWPGNKLPFLKSLSALLFVIIFLKTHNNIKFDIIHAHITGFFTGIIGLGIKLFYKKKLVITIHGSLSCYPKLSIHRSIMCFLLNRTDKVFVVSKAIQEKVRKYCPVRTEVLGNGVDRLIFHPVIDKTEIRRKLDIPQNLQIISNIASMYKLKNHKSLIKAFSEVRKTLPNTYLILIGDGPERNSIVNLINKLKLENYIKLVGSIPHKNVALWLQSADIFVLPSFSEGMPVSLIEALACGLPVIGSNVGGIPDIIVDSRIGLLIDPYNLQDLKNKLIYALTYKWDKEVIADYGAKFSWNSVAKRIIKSYNEL